MATACVVCLGTVGVEAAGRSLRSAARGRETGLEIMAVCVTQPAAMEGHLLFFTLRQKETCVFYCKRCTWSLRAPCGDTFLPWTTPPFDIVLMSLSFLCLEWIPLLMGKVHLC